MAMLSFMFEAAWPRVLGNIGFEAPEPVYHTGRRTLQDPSSICPAGDAPAYLVQQRWELSETLESFVPQQAAFERSLVDLINTGVTVSPKLTTASVSIGVSLGSIVVDVSICVGLSALSNQVRAKTASFASMTPAQLSASLGVSLATTPSAATMTTINDRGVDDGASSTISPGLIIAIGAGAAAIVAILVRGAVRMQICGPGSWAPHQGGAASVPVKVPGKPAALGSVKL